MRRRPATHRRRRGRAGRPSCAANARQRPDLRGRVVGPGGCMDADPGLRDVPGWVPGGTGRVQRLAGGRELPEGDVHAPQLPCAVGVHQAPTPDRSRLG